MARVLVNRIWQNHLGTGLVSPERVRSAFERMASVVDEQNSGDTAYAPMAPDCDGLAYQAALALVFEGREESNGYTERVLSSYRRRAKNRCILYLASSSLFRPLLIKVGLMKTSVGCRHIIRD